LKRLEEVDHECKTTSPNNWIDFDGLAVNRNAPTDYYFSWGTQRVQRRVVIIRPVRPFRPHRLYDPFGSPYERFNRFHYNQYVFSNSEKAYDQGYKDGRKTGEKDGRKDKSYDPERSHYYQEAGFGNFAEAYRDGFSNGYRDGFGSQRLG
jgi:hypothetical protein